MSPLTFACFARTLPLLLPSLKPLNKLHLSFLSLPLLAICWLGTQANSHASLISGPIVNPANGHTYYLLSSNTWTASESEASTLGGHLVTINDAAENAWVLSTFSLFGGGSKDLWIGLTDFASEGSWTWSSEESPSYTNWNSGEPNNSDNQDFAFMLGAGRGSAGRWDDYFDTNTAPPFPLHGVTEAVPEPSAAALLILGAGALLFNRRRKTQS